VKEIKRVCINYFEFSPIFSTKNIKGGESDPVEKHSKCFYFMRRAKQK